MPCVCMCVSIRMGLGCVVWFLMVVVVGTRHGNFRINVCLVSVGRVESISWTVFWCVGSTSWIDIRYVKSIVGKIMAVTEARLMNE